MPTVEERLASLEARMDKMDDLPTLITVSREDMNRGFTQVRDEMARQRDDLSRGFAQVRDEMARQRDDTIREGAQVREDTTRQFMQLREDMAEMRVDIRTRFEQVDRRFTWVLGVQMALMLAVIGSLLGAYLR